MNKKSVLFALGIFLISLVSAQLFGGYGSFSIANFFDSFDSATITYLFVFLILFTLITMGLARLPMFRSPYGRPNSVATGTIAFAFSGLAVYYMYRNNFGLADFFYDIGISGGIFSILIGILLLLMVVFIIWKFKFKGFFFIVGILLIFGAITDIIYEKGWALVLGVVFMIIWFWLWRRTRGYVESSGRWVGDKALGAGKWAGGRVAKAGKRAGKWAGEKAVRQTLGRTPLTKGRSMSKKRAEEEAYREYAEREAYAMRKMGKRASDLQKAYDHHKDIRNDNNAPYQARQASEAEMSRIASQAASEGIRLKY